MKNIFKISLVLFSIILYENTMAQTGQIIVTFQNRAVVNNVWTFDMYFAAGTGYAGPNDNNWSAFTMDADIAVPAGITIVSSSGTSNATNMDAGIGVTSTSPGTPPPNTVQLRMQGSRDITIKPELTATPVLVASISVTFAGGTLTGKEIVTPRTTLNDNGSYWVNEVTFTESPFAQPANFTLPITLVSFSAAKAGTEVKLNWLVSSETNAKGYDVERSSGNGAAFTLIGNVAANNSGKYSSTDASPLSGVNYYRLKMVDVDGKFKYSEVRTVLFDGTTVLFDIYPNPVVSNKLNLHLQQNTYAGKGQAIITDIAGRSIQGTSINIVKGNNQLPITVKSLNSGTYFITVYDAQGNVITDTKKLVKQ